MNEIQFSTLGRIQNSHRLGIELTLSLSLSTGVLNLPSSVVSNRLSYSSLNSCWDFRFQKGPSPFPSDWNRNISKTLTSIFLLIPQSVDGPYNILALLDGPKTSLSGPTPWRIENKKSVRLPFSFFLPLTQSWIIKSEGGGGVIPELCGQVSTSNHKC